MQYLNKTIEYGTLAFVFLIPWQARWIIKAGEINGGYWEYGAISLYATEILLLVVLLALVIKGAVYIKQAKPKFSVKNLKSANRRTAAAVLLFLIWAGLSVIWAINKEVAWEKFIVLAEAGVVFLILISGAVGWRKLSWAIILSGVIQAVLALAQFVTQSIPASTFFGMASQSADVLGASVVEPASGRWLRAYGSFPHPNILGGWLVLGLILIIEQLKQHKLQVASCKLQDFFLIPSFVVILFGLLATFSRSAWLAFLLFLIFYLLLSFIKKKERVLAGAIVGLIVVCVFIFSAATPELFFSRLASSGRLEEKSNIERASSISQSWQIIKQNPILGVGIGNYGLAVHKYLDAAEPAWYYQPAHNVPLLIWSEAGLIGLMGLIAIIWLRAYGLRLTLRQNWSGALLFLPLLIISFFDHYPWSLYPGLLISAVYLGLAFNRLWPRDPYNL